MQSDKIEFLKQEMVMLIEAAEKGHLDKVRLQLSNPFVAANAHVADPRLPTGGRRIPLKNIALIRSATNGHTEIVKALLALPAVQANAAVNRNEAFCSAAANNRLEVVKILLQNSVVVSELNKALNDYNTQMQRHSRFDLMSSNHCQIYINLYNEHALNTLYEKAIQAQDCELITLLKTQLPLLSPPTDPALRAIMETIILQNRSVFQVILDEAHSVFSGFMQSVSSVFSSSHPSSSTDIALEVPHSIHPSVHSDTLEHFNNYLPSSSSRQDSSSSIPTSSSSIDNEREMKNRR